MMGAMRDKKFMKIILWMLVVVFVGFIFVAWGMQVTGFGAPKDPNAAARVGKRVVTYNDFYKRYQTASEQLQGDSPSEAVLQEMKSQILDEMIDDAVILETADRMRVSVSTEEVAESVRRERVFQDENRRFDAQRYVQLLQQNNLTPEQFEESQRQNLLLQKIQLLLAGSVLHTREELRSYAELLNRELQAEYVTLDPKRFASAVSPVRRDLEDYYESNRNRYDKPERAKASHLLLSLREGATPQEEEIIQKTLEEYRERIMSGKATFAELATKHSQDEGSKKDGGSLGWITRGLTVPDFESAVFRLKKGAVSKPVKTPFGYHLIRLDDYEPAYESRFAAVQGRVTEDYRREKGDQRVRELATELERLKKAGRTLREAAQSLKLDVATTPWFTRQGTIPGLKDSGRFADSLSETHLREWKGPLFSDSKRYFFQVVHEKALPLSEKRFEAEKGALADRLESTKRGLWMESFLKNQREELGVKILLETEKETPEES